MLPIDREFGVNLNIFKNNKRKDYVEELKQRLEWARHKAIRINEKEQAKAKRYFDKKTKSAKLDPGDTVLLRQKKLRGKHKISDRWGATLYTVKKRMEGLPVYQIADEEGKTKVIHRNMLYPVVQLQEEIENETIDQANKDEEKEIESGTDDVLDPTITGPTTRSKTRKRQGYPVKALLKANLQMMDHFEGNLVFKPRKPEVGLVETMRKWFFGTK
jgi:hypothetical protein